MVHLQIFTNNQADYYNKQPRNTASFLSHTMRIIE